MPHDKDQALYRLYDETGQLLYVGISVDPGKRLAQHRSDKPWWGDVANIAIQPMPSRKAALKAEEEAIKNERPVHNVVHNVHPVAPLEWVSILRRAIAGIAGIPDSGHSVFTEEDMALVEELLGEHASTFDDSLVCVLAGMARLHGGIPSLYEGLTDLIDSFAPEELLEARSFAQRKARARGYADDETRVLELTARHLAKQNRELAGLQFGTSPAREMAPF